MTVIARFSYADKYLDLTTGNYRLDESFVPPTAVLEPLMTSGGMRDRYSGGRKFDQRSSNAGYALPIQVRGVSRAEMQSAKNRLQRFLLLAGQGNTPLYFEYADSPLTVEPTWGQTGATRRFEIVHAQPFQADAQWGIGTIRNRLELVMISCTLRPFALGQPQRLADGRYGILEDTVGTTDAASRGVIVARGTTNLITNPVFGHATDFDNDWTASSSKLVASSTRNPDYVLFGDTAVSLTNVDTTDHWFYQSPTLLGTDYVISFYAKLPDGGAVTSLIVEPFVEDNVGNPTVLAAVYESVGNGWYRVWAAFATGLSVGSNFGVLVPPAVRVHIDGVQLELGYFPSSLCYGDMIDSAWSSGYNDSSSARTTGQLKLPVSVLNPGEGAMRYVFRVAATEANYNLGGVTLPVVFESYDGSGVTLRLRFNAGNWQLTVGGADTNAAAAFTVGDVIVAHVVWSAAATKVYIDGALTITTNDTPIEYVGDLYIGTDHTGAVTTCGNFAFLDMAIFDEELDATQVTADYTAVAAAIEIDDFRMGLCPPPYLLTRGGDGVIEGCDDTTHQNWAIAGSIPGDVDALTRYEIETDVTTSNPTRMYLARVHLTFPSNVVRPGGATPQWYSDYNFFADANASGGEYITTVTTTSMDTIAGVGSYRPDLAVGRIHVFVRIKGTSGAYTLYAAPMGATGGESVYGSQRALSVTTSWRLFYVGSISIQNYIADLASIGAGLGGYTAPGQSLDIDYVFTPNGELMELRTPGGVVGGTVVIENGRAYTKSPTTGIQTDPYQVLGDKAELVPGFNYVWVLYGPEDDIDNEATMTVTVTPRWGGL
jgi:hypothetical protein